MSDSSRPHGLQPTRLLHPIWMDLEIIILSELRERQVPYDITYMWNLKNDTNELIYRTESDS